MIGHVETGMRGEKAGGMRRVRAYRRRGSGRAGGQVFGICVLVEEGRVVRSGRPQMYGGQRYHERGKTATRNR